jgi:hypothetical protein
MLNYIQRRTIIGGVVVLALMVMFPPWREVLRSHNYNIERPVGYHFIANPPKDAGGPWGAEIDMPRLLIPMLVVAVATGAGVMLTRRPAPSTAIQDLSVR